MNTTARMIMEYQGKKYWFEYDFRYEYPGNCAEFMFFDGNYSCDRNKSLFLNEAGYPGFEEDLFAR